MPQRLNDEYNACHPTSCQWWAISPHHIPARSSMCSTPEHKHKPRQDTIRCDSLSLCLRLRCGPYRRVGRCPACLPAGHSRYLSFCLVCQSICLSASLSSYLSLPQVAVLRSLSCRRWLSFCLSLPQVAVLRSLSSCVTPLAVCLLGNLSICLSGWLAICLSCWLC